MQAFEFAILDWIQANMRCTALDFLMPVVSNLAAYGFIWVVIGVILILTRKYRLCGFTEVIGLGAGSLLNNLLIKNLIARPRPVWLNPDVEILVRIPTDYSFPSGHTAASFTAATVLLCYDRRFGIPAVILACLIAFSRLYLYVHFPTDILAGIFFGILVGILSIVVLKKIALRRASRS